MCKHRLCLNKLGQKLCASGRSKAMDSIKVNKICEENIHEESPVRNASDEDFGEI
jgi:hypothetical protein